MEGKLFVEDGIEMRSYIRGTAIGEETVQFGVFEEGICPLHDIEEEILTLLFCETKRVEIDFVLPDIRSEENSIFFIGDDIAESVLSEGTQPK